MDAVQVLAHATRKYRPRGIKARREVSAEELAGMLCMAFDLGELESDEIFWRMKRWERRNSQYPLLRQWRILDPLGVVWDQRYWEDDLSRMLGFLGTKVQMAAFKMDLDNFKAVNDTLGHASGDEAIRLYCSIVKQTIGKLGEVYRRGGDEVVALISEIDSNQAQALAERIRTSIESQFVVWSQNRGLAHPPTASIGLVVTDTRRSQEDIIRSLDAAQLEAKQKGKNCVVCNIRLLELGTPEVGLG
jgi:diguanylate cyclase (GGDEF)-like protein